MIGKVGVEAAKKGVTMAGKKLGEFFAKEGVQQAGKSFKRHSSLFSS